MKKLIPILMIMFIAACSSDDNISDTNITMTEKGSIYHRQTKNDNGKYNNRFYATYTNSATKDITGHIRFTIKEYGTFNSESGVVPAAPNTENTFFLWLETDKIIDESYLIKAEFVRE